VPEEAAREVPLEPLEPLALAAEPAGLVPGQSLEECPPTRWAAARPALQLREAAQRLAADWPQLAALLVPTAR